MPRKPLLTVKEFKHLRILLSGDGNITNGISDMELKHLSWLAAQVPTGGVIVEIGSHRGKSTCALGAGLRHAGNLTAKLFAIDLWLKGKGKTFDHYSSAETWQIFNDQVAALGLTDLVHTRMMSSKEAASKRRKPIDLLWIDASHKYKDVLLDFTLWEKFVPVGGRIAFHDYGTRFPGVDKVINELVIPSGQWSDFNVVDRIWSARRVA
jgi:MMP 1-O-methyltransferase